jgi:glycosyltransferase involved in cell wall biosynthesis
VAGTESTLQRPLRVMIVAPPWVPVPPPAYGGTEAVLDGLSRGLQAAGAEVTLHTTGESTCPVPRTWTLERAAGVGLGGSVVELRHVIGAYERAIELGVDIVHDHTLAGPVWARALPGTPLVVTTNHGPFVGDLWDYYRSIAPHVPVVAISEHQARTASPIPVAAVIHHGVDLEAYRPGPGDGGYALFLGRMSPDKGVARAAVLARRAGVRLLIAAKMREPHERRYFDEEVKPHLGGGVDYVGEVGGKDKVELLQGAFCLFNPIAWPEPFGMVMIEALACGTPVVTTPFGAAPEIVEDGVVGYVRASERELTEVLARVGQIDRHACRKRVAQHFSVELMVAKHCAVYSEAIGASSRRRSLEILVPGAA